MIGVKVTKGGMAQFDALTRVFGDERLLIEAMVEAAGTVLAAARQSIAKDTGMTGDQIEISTDVPTKAGIVTVLVGIPAKGKSSRHFIGRFLEYGTSKMGARPWLRPAADQHGGAAFVGRMVAFLTSKLRSAA